MPSALILEPKIAVFDVQIHYQCWGSNHRKVTNILGGKPPESVGQTFSESGDQMNRNLQLSVRVHAAITFLLHSTEKSVLSYSNPHP